MNGSPQYVVLTAEGWVMVSRDDEVSAVISVKDGLQLKEGSPAS